MKKYRDAVLFVAAIFILLFFIGNVCPIENIVGIPCPGCNMFTALYWLVQGEFGAAQFYHPAIWPFVIYMVAASVLFLRYKEKTMSTTIFKVISAVFLAVFIGVYVYRMITVFPQYPMTVNEDAILVRLFHLF